MKKSGAMAGLLKVGFSRLWWSIIAISGLGREIEMANEDDHILTENGRPVISGSAHLIHEGDTLWAEGTVIPLSESLKPLPEDHPFYTAIGRVVASYAAIEHELDLLIWNMLGVDDKKGACVTSQIMGIVSRCRVLILLAQQADLPEVSKLVEQFLNRTYKLTESRNRIVHDAWFVHDRTSVAGQFRSMPFKNPQHGFFGVEDAFVADAINQAEDLAQRARSLRESVQHKLMSSG